MSHSVTAITLALLACAACKSEDELHRDMVEKELADLDTALAAGNVVHVTTSCAMLEPSFAAMKPALADRIQRGCFVEVPRLVLEDGIAKVTESKRKNTNLGDDLNCMELFVPGALETVARHPVADAGLQKLVDEYTRMCPAEAAKAKARGSAPP